VKVRAWSVSAALLALAACGSSPSPASPSVTVTAPQVVPPRLAVDGMTTSADPVDLATLAADGVHPEVLRGALDEAGFLGGSSRAAVGGAGPFARVEARRLAFGSPEGALAFVSWLDANAAAELFPAQPFAVGGLDPRVLVLKHEPDGCCPKETRIYLAAWADDADVITVQAQGPRATDDAAASLLRSVVEANR
jgi:hypothetical protein